MRALGIKTVIFDLDGTLLNREASVKLFIDKQYDRLYEVLGHIPKEIYIKRFIELDNHGYIWKDKVYKQLVDEFNLVNMTWEELLEDYLTEFKHSCVSFPNLMEMLEELKHNNFRLGMITNGMGQFQMDNIIALGIEKYFDVILVSEWEGIKKPNPKIFIDALEKLQAKASDTIYVGDHPDNDVKASKDVGMTSVWKRNSHWDDVEADFIIDDLLEILEIIK